MAARSLSANSRRESCKNRIFRRLQRFRQNGRRNGERGATMLEWLLLLVVVALPSYFIIQLGLETLFAHYRLVTTMNGLPLP
ncbi:MAG: hypothetical protein AAF086_05130 [Planctomycetota bacterium]